MALELGARIGKLFEADAAAAECAFFGNAYAALGLGLIALIRWELSIGSALVVAAAVFLLLGGCLLSRPTLWFATLTGTGAAVFGPALPFTSVGLRVHRLAGLLGLVIGMSVGVAFATYSYLRLGAALRRG